MSQVIEETNKPYWGLSYASVSYKYMSVIRLTDVKVELNGMRDDDNCFRVLLNFETKEQCKAVSEMLKVFIELGNCPCIGNTTKTNGETIEEKVCDIHKYLEEGTN